MNEIHRGRSDLFLLMFQGTKGEPGPVGNRGAPGLMVSFSQELIHLRLHKKVPSKLPHPL